MFALSNQGSRDLNKGIAATTLSNLCLIAPVSLLVMVIWELLNVISGQESSMRDHAALFICGTVVMFIIVFLTQWLQYNKTYTVAYKESANRRIVLAEKLRKLPLSFFGQRDLSDLTTTIMGDCTALERVFSNAIPQLFGTIFMFIITAIGLLVLDWRMGLCIVVPVPVAALVVFAAKKAQSNAESANMDAKRLYIDITVKANCWHFFCFPFDVKRSNISCKGSFVFRYYDGKVRADKGKGGWTNLPDTEEYLRAGKGYIFQTSMDATLSILIEKDKFGKLPGVTVSGSLEANASTNEQDASWNFVGNPFTSFFNVDENGFAAPITRWNGSTYEAVRPGDDDITLHPFEAFFVQCPADNDKIEFDAANRTTQIKSEKQAEANKQKRRQSTLNPNRLMVNLTLGNGNDSDNTRVVFNPEKSARYEMECDAAKFESGTAAVQLYSIEAKAGKMAINERQAGSVRLGYTASKGGTYTISAMRMDQPVLLRDNVMNVTYDLSNGDYQFTSEAGTFDDRFMIMIDGSATGVADIARESGVNILPMQGGMNITGTEGQTVNVYALSGAIVATRTSDGFLSLTKGVYVVEVGQMKAKVAVK